MKWLLSLLKKDSERQRLARERDERWLAEETLFFVKEREANALALAEATVSKERAWQRSIDTLVALRQQLTVDSALEHNRAVQDFEDKEAVYKQAHKRYYG